MRILLNLLPEEKKGELARRFYSRFFLWQTSFLFLLTLFYTGVLGSMYFLLNYQERSAALALESFGQYNAEAKKLTQYQETFKKTNTLTQDVNRYLDRHLSWSNLFLLLHDVTPADVAFTNLVTKDYTTSLIGEAATREAFLNFESSLKASSCTSDVKVPISNLFTQKEVEFQIDFNIKRECLVKTYVPERYEE